jgi:hypothetical protein
MKIKILLSILMAVTCCIHAQLTGAPTPEWKVTFKVVDEAGDRLAGVKVVVGYMGTNQISGLTDTNGIFVASHRDKSYTLGFDITKESFYATHQEYELGWAYQYAYEKWNPFRTIVLRKVGNTIPMYTKRQEVKFPKLNEPIGFDLMVGDWITPYGKGFHTDILFKAHREIKNDHEFTADLSVTFPNGGDGIVAAPSESADGSAFKTSRIAAENGYAPELNLHYSNLERPKSVFGYFIRVHTELDQDGNVKSALYGKINGDFRFYTGTIAPTSGMGFDYYLNPTPNSRNLEFDPKENLVKDLKPLEAVKEP